MSYLLDTFIVSELQREGCAPGIRSFMQGVDDNELFLSSISIGEIVRGIELLAVGRKKDTLSAWLGHLEADFGSHILPVTTETAQIWGQLTAQARRRGRPVPACDGLIAATAIQHGLQLVTRSLRSPQVHPRPS